MGCEIDHIDLFIIPAVIKKDRCIVGTSVGQNPHAASSLSAISSPPDGVARRKFGLSDASRVFRKEL